MSNWETARDLFLEAVNLPPREREEFLDRACANEPTLRQEIDKLLASDQDAGESFLEPVSRGSLDSALLAAGEPTVPAQIGPYTIVRLLAAGGMGLVYEARQSQPSRRVALKTLRWSLGSEAAVRRFHLESEILGMLDHPGIAKIYDAGIHEMDGHRVPYFAMEYIEGAENLLDAVKKRNSREEALRLFLDVCDAVEAGHRQGVIHRDLKADNILVGTDGRPRIIDFGLARATSPELSALSLAESRSGQMMGTLETMSPEHFRGKPNLIDTRSDVYSLGCLLYQIVSGHGPHDFGEHALHELARIVMEREPRSPSGAPRELSWVLQKAVAREPHRRYSTVQEFASDLSAYLKGEQVQAAPPSGWYRARKFVQRHRTLFATIGAVILALSIGLEQARRRAREATESQALAERNAEAAKRHAATAERHAQTMDGVNQFFRRALSQPSYYNEALWNPSVREAMDDALTRLQSNPTLDPESYAALQTIVGNYYCSLGEDRRAEELLEEALAYLRETHERTSALRVRAEISWANLLLRANRATEGIAHGEEWLPDAKQVLGVDDDVLLLLETLGACYLERDRPEKAEAVLRTSLKARVSQPGSPKRDLAQERDLLLQHSMLAAAVTQQGRFAEARALADETMELARETLEGDDSLWVLEQNLYSNAFALGDHEWAIERTWDLSERIHDAENPPERCLYFTDLSLSLFYQDMAAKLDDPEYLWAAVDLSREGIDHLSEKDRGTVIQTPVQQVEARIRLIVQLILLEEWEEAEAEWENAILYRQRFSAVIPAIDATLWSVRSRLSKHFDRGKQAQQEILLALQHLQSAQHVTAMERESSAVPDLEKIVDHGVEWCLELIENGEVDAARPLLAELQALAAKHPWPQSEQIRAISSQLPPADG